MGQITTAVKLPLYLDSFGTVLMAVLVGPWGASFTGIASNALSTALGNAPMIFFAPVMVVIAFFTGTIARAGWFRKWYLVLIGGIAQGILAAIISAPISTYLFSGVMMAGTDVLVLFFRSMGNTILESVFYQGVASDPVDKTITYFLAFTLIQRIPLRLLRRFPGGMNVITHEERNV